MICYNVGHSERLQSYNGHFDFPDILKYCTVVLGTYKTEIEWRRKREEKKEKNKREKNKINKIKIWKTLNFAFVAKARLNISILQLF